MNGFLVRHSADILITVLACDYCRARFAILTIFATCIPRLWES